MFETYFNFSALIDLAKKLFEAKGKKRNSELVKEIKHRWSNLKDKTKKMSKEEINNEKPDDILGMIHGILDFNKKIQKQQGSGLKLKMETIFMNTENSKTSEPHRFELDLTDKLNLKNPNKNMALANLSIYYTWKNIKSEYKNNKFKISARTWNKTFNLPDGSYSITDI